MKSFNQIKSPMTDLDLYIKTAKTKTFQHESLKKPYFKPA